MAGSYLLFSSSSSIYLYIRDDHGNETQEVASLLF